AGASGGRWCGDANQHGGLDALDQCLDAMAPFTPAQGVGMQVGHDQAESLSQSLSSSASRHAMGCLFKQPRNVREEEEFLLALTPRCVKHQRRTKLLTVKKTGLNKGRRFYVCSLPRGEGCAFFMWADDNPAMVRSELQRQETLEEWRDRKAKAWMEGFRKLPVAELKKELKKRGLTQSGKKDDLVQRL
ncbi:unnamed protein product, partial [Discosporangium mesarthrocarpum]